MADPKLISQSTPGAQVERLPGGHGQYRLQIPAGDANAYRVAQLSDYAGMKRGHFPHRTPVVFNLSARVSGKDLPGTWGFGFWNDPFGLSIGRGGEPFRLPALPNAAWFFGASRDNHLTFSDQPAHGFLAQTFRAPQFHPKLILAGLSFPFSRQATRRWMSEVVKESGCRLEVEPAQWHRYKLEWRENRVRFEVDEILVFESMVTPHPPLGLVIWIDNQFARFTPQGNLGFGVLANPEPAWLEVKDISLL